MSGKIRRQLAGNLTDFPVLSILVAADGKQHGDEIITAQAIGSAWGSRSQSAGQFAYVAAAGNVQWIIMKIKRSRMFHSMILHFDYTDKFSISNAIASIHLKLALNKLKN